MNTENDDIKTILDHLRVDERPGPALPLSLARMQETIGALIERRSALIRRRWYTGLVIGVLLAGSAVATFAYELASVRAPVRIQAPATLDAHGVEHGARVASSGRAEMAAGGDPVIDVTELPVAPSAERARVSHTAVPRAGDTVDTRPESEAEDLLRAANRLRSEKAWAEAARMYERVIEAHAGSAPAYPAMVAAGTLRLERLSDPNGALRLYRRALALRPGGALSEDALFGIARAERALGRPAAEREALEQLLAAYPSSWHAAKARDRLAELGSAR